MVDEAGEEAEAAVGDVEVVVAVVVEAVAEEEADSREEVALHRGHGMERARREPDISVDIGMILW